MTPSYVATCPTNRLKLKKACIFPASYDADGLITAVVTDVKSGGVLMVAHMNAEAVARTVESGEAWYYSRSRKKLWKKGETSGHVQRVIELRVDCDQDALWLKVEQVGEGACHTGRRSCFYRAVPLGKKGAVDARIPRRRQDLRPQGRLRQVMSGAARVDLKFDARERGTVAYLTVDNRTKLNTLDRALMIEFIEQVAQLSTRADLRALVLAGAGDKAFIGGASIPEMAALDRDSAEGFITLVHRTCDVLRRLPVPVIARIDGYALGAGLEVAVSCDLRVATTRAKFGMPEVKVGIPSVVEAALIPTLIGFGRARELLMLGEIIDADTALRWGLVERVVAPEALDAEVEKIVASLLAAGAQAVREQKALMQAWEKLSTDAAIQAGIDAFARAYATEEPRQSMNAFLKRRR